MIKKIEEYFYLSRGSEISEMEEHSSSKSSELNIELQNIKKEAEFAIAEQRFSEALALFENALLLSAEDPDIYVSIGNVHGFLGNKSASLLWYDKALALDPGFWRAHHNLGMYYLEKKQNELAEKHLLKALDAAPDSYIILNSLGNLYSKEGEMEKGINYLEKAILVKPGGYIAEYNLGKTYYDLKDWDKAIELLENALALNSVIPEHPYNIDFLLAEAYKNKNDVASSIKYYEKLTGIENRDLNTYSCDQLARIYQNLGINRQVMFYLEKLLNINPQHEDKWSALLHYFSIEEDHENGIIAAKKAIEYFPENCTFLFYLADSLGRLKQFAEALPVAQKLVLLSPNEAAYHAILGLFYNALGNWGLALQEFKETYKYIGSSGKHIPFKNIINCLNFNGEKELAGMFNNYQDANFNK